MDPQYTDIDVYEAGWGYVDQEKIVVYGGIDDSDSNGNGVLDSEEGTDTASDFDGDGTADFQDTDTARVRHAKGAEKVCVHASKGDLAAVRAMSDDDPNVTQTGKPSLTFPYGTIKFNIVGLNPGDEVTVSLVFPDAVPTTATYYKISASRGWREIPFGSNDGDNTITLTLTDGDADTDADELVNGTIVDPGALALSSTGVTPTASGDDGGGGGGCFIGTAAGRGEPLACQFTLGTLRHALVHLCNQ
jgi:hypothetical protein